MSFHILPRSRRGFLRSTLAGSLGISAVRWLEATPAGSSTHWALFSDPHIAADPLVEKNGINMTERLAKAVTEARAFSIPLAGLILNGDCALDAGLPEDYVQFTSLMKSLADQQVAMHFTLGNHDERTNFWSALKESAALPRPVAGKQVTVIEAPEANWFLLDSLDVTKQASGLLGPEQRTWLLAALEARADKPALVMVHHNPVPPDGGKSAALLDADDLLALLAPRRHVKAIFYGHTHTWRLKELDGLHLVNLPAVGYPFQENEVTGWVHCQLTATQMNLDLRAHDTSAADHGRVHQLIWRA